MTYRGIVKNGVVVIDGEKPAAGTVVELLPMPPGSPSPLPGFGLWADRDRDAAGLADDLRHESERRAEK